MHCARCRHENPEGAKFCNACGAKLERACPTCGHVNPPESRFCNECGGNLVQPPSPAPERRSASPQSYTPRHLAERILAEQAALEARGSPDGERKIITALFADIKGSMELIEDLDPEEARRIVDPALRLMMKAVHRYEGYVAQSLGDGIFALFGAPIAHEDHAQRAIYAALRMQEEIRRYAEKLRLEHGVNIEIRVGLNSGEVVVRSIRTDDLHTDYVPIGHSTSLAARLQSLASGGAVVVSEHTHKLTEGYFAFKPLGAAQVKGVSDPVEIYEVMGVGPLRTRLQVAARRGLVHFVGRQRELEQMQKALELAKGGHGQIIAVVGEPGVGKSRLCYEFKLVSQRGYLVLETFSVSHSKAYPYLPLIELLKQYFQITPQDDERQRREKITGKVLTLDRSLEDTFPYLFALLGIFESTPSLSQMDPQIRRRRTFEVVKRLLVRESLNQPLLLIIEDLHWLDGESEAFLSLLSESIATARLLLLVNYRPEYQHSWGNKTFYTQLRLDPLGQEEAHELLTVLLGDGEGLQDFKQLILAKTEGNPFFMEEIVQALFEQGVLLRDPAGRAKRTVSCITRPLTDIQLPSSAQGVLAGRIDRLPAEEKALLQALAAIGKEFSLNLLKRVVDQPEDELQRLLTHLQAAEFIYEQPAFPEPEYTFKHVLTQEVAYNSLLLERRRALHERTAQAIEALFRDRLEEHYSELAHHYHRSGNLAKAVEYLQRTGQQAVRRSEYAQAVGHLTPALDLLKTLPDTVERARQELDLQITIGQSLVVIKGYATPEVEHAYNRARELSRQVGDPPQLFRALLGLRGYYHVRGELQIARELGEQGLSFAQRMRDPALLAQACSGLGHTLYYLGEFLQSREHLEQATTFSQQHHVRVLPSRPAPRVDGSAATHAWVLWYLGYPDQALQRSDEWLTTAQGLSQPYSLEHALSSSAIVYLLRRDGHTALARAEAAIAISSEHGFPFRMAWGTILRGWALAERGQDAEGIMQMQRGLDAYRSTGAEVSRPWFLAQLARAYGKTGQAKEGLTVLDEAIAAVPQSGQCFYAAELYRLKGELLLAASVEHRVETEACLQKALDIARRQQAKSLELRAAMSLSRLWRQQGKKEEACQLLDPIYGWFTEGFDTVDLQEARALLDEFKDQRTPRRRGQKGVGRKT